MYNVFARNVVFKEHKLKRVTCQPDVGISSTCAGCVLQSVRAILRATLSGVRVPIPMLPTLWVATGIRCRWRRVNAGPDRILYNFVFTLVLSLNLRNICHFSIWLCRICESSCVIKIINIMTFCYNLAQWVMFQNAWAKFEKFCKCQKFSSSIILVETCPVMLYDFIVCDVVMLLATESYDFMNYIHDLS